MKKIPTIYQRDWNGDRSRVLNEPHPDCSWVFTGEGTATQKIDGTSCLVRDGKLFKRRELKPGQVAPEGYLSEGADSETGKTVGWVPVNDGPEDRRHREAFALHPFWYNGTYELVGPSVQGNPEKLPHHILVKHGSDIAGKLYDVPLEFDALRLWLDGQDIEGIVWHHPDGRMAKIKLRDFGLSRKSV